MYIYTYTYIWGGMSELFWQLSVSLKLPSIPQRSAPQWTARSPFHSVNALVI